MKIHNPEPKLWVTMSKTRPDWQSAIGRENIMEVRGGSAVCETTFPWWRWSAEYGFGVTVQNLRELERKGGFGTEAARIPTMFQLRPTTRRFCVFVFVCVAGMGRWKAMMLAQVVTVEFLFICFKLS